MGQARCPLLVGRDEELDTLRRAVDRAAAGQGGCVLVTGEAGVGKSRLLTTVVEAASSSGTVVLRGQAVPSPAPAPYRPLIEAFTSGLRGRPPPSGGPASAGLAPALELLVPAWRTDPAADRAEPSVVLVGEAALTLLDVADVGHGVLVALDDLQGADPETLGVLDYLVRQIADRPVLIVATARHGEVDGADRWVRSLADRRAARVLEPARLSDEEVAAMVTACLAPPTPAAEVVTMLARRAGGLPLLVEDLLTTLLEAGSLTLDGDRWAVCGEVRSVVPSSFATSVADRVAALPAPVRRVVEAAAVVGERFDWRTVAATTGESDGVVVAALRRAVGVGLVEEEAGHGFRFRHSLTTDAVLAPLTAPERAALARRALAVVAAPEVHDADRAELAAGLAELAEDPASAVAWLLSASRAAMAQGAVSSARRAAERAGRLAACPAHMVAADRALLETGVAAGDATDVVEVGERLLARLEALAAPLPERAEVHRRLASAAVVATDWTRAGEHLRAAHELEPTPPRATEAHDEIVRAEVALGEHLLPEAARHATAAREAAAGAGRTDLESDACALQGRALRLRDLDLAEQHLTAALARAELAGSALRRAHALHELGTIDVVRAGDDRRVREARRLALAIGAPGLAASADLQLAILSWKRFALDEARAAARRAAEAGRRYGLGLLVPLARILEGDVDAVLGRREAAQAAFERARPEMDAEIEATGRGNLLAVAALAVEDRAGARDELARAAALAPPDSASARSPQAGLRALLDAVEDAPEASRTCTELAATSTLDTIARSFGELAAAVLAGRRGDAGPAGAAVAAAVEADLARTPWHQAMGRRLVAEAAVADGWGEPARWAREALEFFEAADVAEPARASRSLLRRAGGTVPQRPSGLPDELARLGITPREADVLTLLATGLANREIATRLYVSVRTVEKHVERIMVKTSTRRRSQLAARYG